MTTTRLSVAAAALTIAMPLAVADDKPPGPERLTVRVTGLFAPDRAADLKAAFAELPDLTLVAVDYAESEMTVEFVPAKVFPGAKPAELVARLDQKVRAATRTFGVRPRRTAPREKLQEVVIPVAGCVCRACDLAAYETVARVDGVEQATASFKEGRVTVLIDPAKADRGKVEETLRNRNVKIVTP